MKIATVIHNYIEKVVVIKDNVAHDHFKGIGYVSDLKDLIERDQLGALRNVDDEASSRIPLSDLEFLPVVTHPAKVICVGLNYETHRVEARRDKTDHPSIFTRFADTQVGHRQPLLIPRVSDSFDYEGEVAIIIGKPGRYIRREDAYRHVAGYSCYNDATVRDWQRHTIQFTPGKNFPATGAIGPWMVTSDEIASPDDMKIETILNGEIMQSAYVRDMIFPIPELIEYISAFTPLASGDVIATGTPGGVGFKREPAVYMKAGDMVTIRVSGIGELSNPILKEG